jgi:poly-gamma-glutamate synthesis protein (capsule biosynthesis protein)
MLLGDIMFTRNINDELYGSYPDILKESDLTIANLEFPIETSKNLRVLYLSIVR